MDEHYKPLSVSDALDSLNQTLAIAHPALLIEGEVSSFKVNQGKFVFFDLKDQNGSLGCFMMLFQLKFPIEDGMKIQVVAEPKITKFGKFSLTIKALQPVGEGSLKKSLQALKEKLQKEGLFDIDRKRPLPKYPKNIGIVSSSQAAGYQDFIKVLNNRWSGLDITLVDTTVQGLDAPQKISEAIEQLNLLQLDVIAIIRGGGSSDDLAAFSSEQVVRAVASSRTPTIVGIGHEVDEVLVDLASDKRAATPSNAAEILVPDKNEVLKNLNNFTKIMNREIEQKIISHHEVTMQRTNHIKERIDNLLSTKLEAVTRIKKLLVSLSPSATLKRGYSLVYKQNTVVQSIAGVTIGDILNIEVQDGQITGKVSDVRKKT